MGHATGFPTTRKSHDPTYLQVQCLSAQPLLRGTVCTLCLCLCRHIKARSSAIGKELDLALQWFLEVLSRNIAEERRFERVSSRTAHLFTDARSTPPRVAAVLFM